MIDISNIVNLQTKENVDDSVDSMDSIGVLFAELKPDNWTWIQWQEVAIKMNELFIIENGRISKRDS